MGKTDKSEEAELRKQKNEEIKDYGQTVLDSNESEKRIQLLSIIGEIEGHETINNSKNYEEKRDNPHGKDHRDHT